MSYSALPYVPPVVFITAENYSIEIGRVETDDLAALDNHPAGDNPQTASTFAEYPTMESANRRLSIYKFLYYKQSINTK